MAIAVYGATGFVGGLVTVEALRRDVPVVLVGRDPGRLRAAAARAGAPWAQVRVAGLDDHPALVDALAGTDAVINCASPFVTSGEPVVRAAIDAGVHYVDVSGEGLHVQHVLDAHDAAARAAGVVVLPGANNDCLTGDLLGHLLADGIGELDTLSVAFAAHDAEGSRGTVLMALTNKDVFRSGGPVWDRGRFREGVGARRTSVRWPGETEASPVVRFALPPALTLPRHVDSRHVEALAPPQVQDFFASASREVVDGMPLRGGPSAEARARARFFLVLDATTVDGRHRRAELSARDIYGTTAVIVVDVARRLAAGGTPAGAHAPGEVLPAAEFLDALAPVGLRWTVEEPSA